MLGVQVEGLEELIEKNKRAIKKLESGELTEEIAKKVVWNIKRIAPRLTGRMIRSVEYKKIDDNSYMFYVTAENEEGECYAIYLEFGTSHIPIGTPDNPRWYRSGSGKIAALPFVRTAIHKCITNKQLGKIVDIIASIYKE